MAHSYAKIFVHLVWSTKNWKRFITHELRRQLFQHIMEYCKLNDIRVDSLAIQPEHVHALVSLRSDQKVDDVAKLIKGESSHWVNAENLVHPKFSWQRGYGAFSVSPSQVGTVREYIKNQDEHHRKKSFGEELEAILSSLGFNISNMEMDEQNHGQNR